MEQYDSSVCRHLTYDQIIGTVAAVSTAIAAGAACWSAFASRDAAKSADETAQRSAEALSAALRPSLRVEFVSEQNGIVSFLHNDGPTVAIEPEFEVLTGATRVSETRARLEPNESFRVELSTGNSTPAQLMGQAITATATYADERRLGRWQSTHTATINIHAHGELFASSGRLRHTYLGKP